MKRSRLIYLSALCAAIATGCASEPEPQKSAAVAQAPPAVNIPGDARAASTNGDVQTLQQGRRQDAQAIQDAQKALGALGH